MSTNFNHPQFSKAGIDGKTTGAVQIGTTENGSQRFIPTSVIVEVTAGTAIIAVATLSIGTNSPTYNNILAATALTGLTGANQMTVQHLPVAALTSVAPNTGVFLNITVGATATTCTLRVDILGYYL